MNSAIQCLNACTPLFSYFNSEEYCKDLLRNKDKDTTFVKEFHRLTSALHEITSKDTVICPSSFKHKLSLSSMTFLGSLQQDSSECIGFILEMIHKQIACKANINIEPNLLNLVKNKELCILSCEVWKKTFEQEYSIITDLFYSQFHGKLSCTKCKSLRHSFEPFTMLTLEIPEFDNSTLYSCLNTFITEEEIELKEICKCGNNTYKKNIILWKTGSILIIILKRFKSKDSITSKIHTKVDYPFYLNINNYMSKDSYCNQLNIKDTYSLFGVVIHEGSPNSGHYYSYCEINNDWFELNDTIVNKMNKDDVISNKAYILFYKRN